jgi:hypothetical protein
MIGPVCIVQDSFSCLLSPLWKTKQAEVLSLAFAAQKVVVIAGARF